jgi:E3 ubiquitin-protein ligase BRE1
LVLEEDTNNTDAPSTEQVKRSDLYAQLTSKLATSDRKILEFEEGLGKIREECSQALGNAELARTALEDLQSKHSKKWAELSQEAEEDELAVTSTKSQGEQIVTLQHKLTQALENVRQAETTRRTLTEAVTMNESLQAKLDEIKTKYGALQAGRSSSNSNNNSGSSTNHVSTSSSSGGLSTPKPKSSSTPAQSAEKGEKMERLHREYRKVRKELAAVTASKEAAKSKLERIEKERDALVQTNARLLKQSAEKDDMNAKSLSTILHLKQVTDQITKERKSLEQQAKSANQLALAARLAANGRERVSEEFMKEKKTLEQQVEDWEHKHTGLLKEKETMNGKNSQQKAKMEALLKDVDKAKSRCEELATESTRLQEEKQKMMESLAIAQREATDAVKASEGLRGSSGGSGIPSEFTAEQLNTQVSVLKSRLACPVCNHRDKKCILLRCRHMFCRPCVDENIKNRSRKCPACGQRFDTKDVADVWL